MKIAKTIVLNMETGVLTIDGREFGYRLADEPIKITYPSRDQGGPRTVWLPVLAEDCWPEPQAELPEGA